MNFDYILALALVLTPISIKYLLQKVPHHTFWLSTIFLESFILLRNSKCKRNYLHRYLRNTEF
jgi:hypothetical protein